MSSVPKWAVRRLEMEKTCPVGNNNVDSNSDEAESSSAGKHVHMNVELPTEDQKPGGNQHAKSPKKSVTFIRDFPKVFTDIPGKARPGPFSSCGSLIGIKVGGHNYTRKQMRKYNSTVFRIHFFGPRIVICDHKGMQSLFQSDVIKKEPRFGSLLVNKNILRGHIPMEFSNGVNHDTTRDFMSTHLPALKSLDIENLSNTVDEEFKLMSESATNCNDFEDVVGRCVCNVVTRTILGCHLNYTQVKIWFENLLVPVFKENRIDDSDGVRASDILAKEIEESPLGSLLCAEGEKHEIGKNEIVVELLHMIIFNSWAALTGLVLSGIIYMTTTLNEVQRSQLKRDAQGVLQERKKGTVSHLDAFIKEVIRLHPPAKSIFGTAKEEFNMESQSGCFKIQKDDLLCGDIYWTQRDPNVFENPDMFDFERFSKDPDLENYLFAFGGNYHDGSHSFHKCMGQHFALTLSKLFFSHLTFCTITPSCSPKWSGTKIMRVAASDKPFTIKGFEYNRPMETEEVIDTCETMQSSGSAENAGYIKHDDQISTTE